jgi:hypothetical protein
VCGFEIAGETFFGKLRSEAPSAAWLGENKTSKRKMKENKSN